MGLSGGWTINHHPTRKLNSYGGRGIDGELRVNNNRDWLDTKWGNFLNGCIKWKKMGIFFR